MQADSDSKLGRAIANITEQLAVRRDRESALMAASPIPGLEQDRADAMKVALRSRWAALVPVELGNPSLRFLPVDAGSTAAVRQWTEGSWRDGVNLVLTGPVGGGKTFAAFAAAKTPFAAGVRVKFWPMVELIAALDWKLDTANATLHEAMTVPLLILDDVGVERDNAWVAEKLYTIVNRRWLDDLPVIVTTNLDSAVLIEQLGERTYSRLIATAVTVRIDPGRDRRRDREGAPT